MEQAGGRHVPGDFTRRDMLKRGAIAGGAAIWVVPALDVIGIGRQYAQAASTPPPAKIEKQIQKDERQIEKDPKDKNGEKANKAG